MKANTSALMRKGYTTGVLSGMTWGLDTVLIGVAMAMSPFVEIRCSTSEELLSVVCFMMRLLHCGCWSSWVARAG